MNYGCRRRRLSSMHPEWVRACISIVCQSVVVSSRVRRQIHVCAYMERSARASSSLSSDAVSLTQLQRCGWQFILAKWRQKMHLAPCGEAKVTRWDAFFAHLCAERREGCAVSGSNACAFWRSAWFNYSQLFAEWQSMIYQIQWRMLSQLQPTDLNSIL